MEPVRLQIELDRNDGAIRGQITDLEGLTTIFSGWLELSTLLEHARLGPPSNPGPDPLLRER